MEILESKKSEIGNKMNSIIVNLISNHIIKHDFISNLSLDIDTDDNEIILYRETDVCAIIYNIKSKQLYINLSMNRYSYGIFRIILDMIDKKEINKFVNLFYFDAKFTYLKRFKKCLFSINRYIKINLKNKFNSKYFNLKSILSSDELFISSDGMIKVVKNGNNYNITFANNIIIKSIFSKIIKYIKSKLKKYHSCKYNSVNCSSDISIKNKYEA